ncbi:MAG: DNA-binding protein [Nitrosarchaeum sp.]|nr:DNA-binding protein [Nitrosarchaeum sp.]
MSTNKSKDAEDILSEFQGSTEQGSSSTNPEPEPQLESPEPEPQLESPEPEPQLEDHTNTPTKSEDRDVIFVGTKPIMTYVSATLTQLSTRHTVTIKARGKRITQAVDVSQMIVKRMDTVGYVIGDVRISSDSLTSQDGKQRNVSTIEIDITKK